MEFNMNKMISYNRFQNIDIQSECKFCDIWDEAVKNTRYVYKGELVKNGEEVIDYLFATIDSLLETYKNT